MNNNISFCASKKINTTIQHRFNRFYIPEDAAIVELDKTNKNDVITMYDLSADWHKSFGKNYADDIFSEIGKDEEMIGVNKEHYLALTTQKNNFKKLDPHSILGVLMLSERDCDNEINWFQVKPDTKSKIKGKREFKQIGLAILNYVKSTFIEKPLFVTSSVEAVNFYKKNKFKQYQKYYKYLLCYRA